jgi:hypothetical protein
MPLSTCTPASRPLNVCPRGRLHDRLVDSLEKSILVTGKTNQANGESRESFSLALASDRSNALDGWGTCCVRVIENLGQSEYMLAKVEPPTPHERAEYPYFSEILRDGKLVQCIVDRQP